MAFIKGQSGNRAGRPKGRTDKRNRFRQMFEAEAEEIVRKVIELAKSGDPVAMKLALERCVPRMRDEQPRRPLSLGGETLEAQGRSVVAAIAAGELAPDEGASLLNGLARQGELEKLGMIADIVAKLAADRGIEVPAELRLRQRMPTTVNQEPTP